MGFQWLDIVIYLQSQTKLILLRELVYIYYGNNYGNKERNTDVNRNVTTQQALANSKSETVKGKRTLNFRN